MKLKIGSQVGIMKVVHRLAVNARGRRRWLALCPCHAEAAHSDGYRIVDSETAETVVSCGCLDTLPKNKVQQFIDSEVERVERGLPDLNGDSAD